QIGLSRISAGADGTNGSLVTGGTTRMGHSYRWEARATVVIVLVAFIGVLLRPMPAQAMNCPYQLDLYGNPFGACMDCSAYGIQGTFTCSATDLGNGHLGCSCQNSANYISCTDPNIQRCGGVLPWCSSLDICILNTALTCVVAGTSIPAYAP